MTTFLLTVKALLQRVPVRVWLALAVIVVVCLALLGWCAADRRAGTAKDQATLADARTASAREAGEILADNVAAGDVTRREVQEAQDAIRREADPAARARVFRERVCKLDPSACAE
jgi:type VI protein secretion system component VasK